MHYACIIRKLIVCYRCSLTLKKWEWPGDEATIVGALQPLAVHVQCSILGKFYLDLY